MEPAARGPEDVKRVVTMLRAMLTDFQIEVEGMVAEDDMVVSRCPATATGGAQRPGHAAPLGQLSAMAPSTPATAASSAKR